MKALTTVLCTGVLASVISAPTLANDHWQHDLQQSMQLAAETTRTELLAELGRSIRQQTQTFLSIAGTELALEQSEDAPVLLVKE